MIEWTLVDKYFWDKFTNQNLSPITKVKSEKYFYLNQQMSISRLLFCNILIDNRAFRQYWSPLYHCSWSKTRRHICLGWRFDKKPCPYLTLHFSPLTLNHQITGPHLIFPPICPFVAPLVAFVLRAPMSNSILFYPNYFTLLCDSVGTDRIWQFLSSGYFVTCLSGILPIFGLSVVISFEVLNFTRFWG